MHQHAYENGAVANSLSQLHSNIKCGQKTSLTNAHTFVHFNIYAAERLSCALKPYIIRCVFLFLVDASFHFSWYECPISKYWMKLLKLFRYNGRLAHSHILNGIEIDRSNAWMHLFSPLYFIVDVHKCKCNSFFHFLHVNKRHTHRERDKDDTSDTNTSFKVVGTITANIHSFNGRYSMHSSAHFAHHHILLKSRPFIQHAIWNSPFPICSC